MRAAIAYVVNCTYIIYSSRFQLRRRRRPRRTFLSTVSIGAMHGATRSRMRLYGRGPRPLRFSRRSYVRTGSSGGVLGLFRESRRGWAGGCAHPGVGDDPGGHIADIHEDGHSLSPGTGAREETGRGSALGTKLNIPLPPGAADREVLTAWQEVEQGLRAFRPEFILLQCGADSIDGDPLAHLRLSPAAH